MGLLYNNDASGMIIGELDICQNYIMENLINVKIRPTS